MIYIRLVEDIVAAKKFVTDPDSFSPEVQEKLGEFRAPVVDKNGKPVLKDGKPVTKTAVEILDDSLKLFGNKNVEVEEARVVLDQLDGLLKAEIVGYGVI